VPGSFSAGSVGGIRIDIHVSWLIVVSLLTVSLALDFFPQVVPGYSAILYWLVGLVATLWLFISVLLHELGHSLVARARGLSVSSITFFIFGGISNLEQWPRGPGDEFLIAIAGPLISLALGGLCLALALTLRPGVAMLQVLLVFLGSANLLLGGFNLLPGFPLDGGRVLRSILWQVTGSLQRATQWAARVGQAMALLFILLGVLEALFGALLAGIWIGVIGLFLLSASYRASAQAKADSLSSGDLSAQTSASMTDAPVSV
jgi:Zn-dependent protease